MICISQTFAASESQRTPNRRGNAPPLPDELFFSTLTRRLLRRGQFTSRDELAKRIDDFVLAYDEHDAKPYRLDL